MKKKRWLLLGVGFAFLSVVWFCCLLILQLGSENDFTTEYLIFSSEEAYRFDPQTILHTRLENGTDPFEQIPFPEEFPAPTLPSVSWTQEDYLHVVNLLLREVEKERLHEWNLNKISGSVKCAILDEGGLFQHLNIEVFKEIDSLETSRQELSIVVEPSVGIVWVFRRTYAPDLGSWSVDWGNIKIPAEQALWIAERNGGIAVRESLRNDCQIKAFLTAGVEKNDWRLYYEPSDGLSVLEIVVDERTGKVRALREFGGVP